MLGPKWANSSSVKMEELEAFQLCDEIQAESSLDRSVHFENSEYMDSIFGASWGQQWCNLRSFNGGINNIDPRIDRRSVLVISWLVARLSWIIAHWSYRKEIWCAVCASPAVLCQNSFVVGCGTGHIWVIRTGQLCIGTRNNGRWL